MLHCDRLILILGMKTAYLSVVFVGTQISYTQLVTKGKGIILDHFKQIYGLQVTFDIHFGFLYEQYMYF